MKLKNLYNKVEISIIIPVYNSQFILPKLIKNLKVVLRKKFVNFEIVLINDFSKDKSWKIIKLLSKRYKFVKGINLSENFGQHNALMAGFNECKGKFIITMDDDFQHSPTNIFDIYNQLINGAEACYVTYLNRKHELWKKFLSYANHVISSFLLNKSLNIYCSSYRGFKNKILVDIIRFKKSNVYIDALILNSAKNISVVPVPHYQRLKGISNYNFYNLFSLWTDMVENSSIKPLRTGSIIVIILKFIIKTLKKKKNLKNKKQYSIIEKTYN